LEENSVFYYYYYILYYTTLKGIQLILYTNTTYYIATTLIDNEKPKQIKLHLSLLQDNIIAVSHIEVPYILYIYSKNSENPSNSIPNRYDILQENM